MTTCKTRVLALSATGLMLVLAACGKADSAQTPTDLDVTSASAGQYSLVWKQDGSEKVHVFAAADPSNPAAEGKEVATVEGTSTEVAGLDPLSRWYFEVQNEDGNSSIASTRHVALQGAANVRDIGGYATEAGQSVKWGLVFRGDRLNDLTADDQQVIDNAGIRTVVDFRGDSEIAKDGPDKVPANVKVLNTPVLDPGTQALATAITSALKSGDPAIVEQVLGGGEAVRISETGAVDQLSKPDGMAGYSQTLRTIADSESAVAYHCTAGKDRTGLMTALLLGILGVPDKTIVDDFVLSNTYNKAKNEQTYTYLSSKGINVDLLKPLMEQRPSQIQPVLDKIQDQFGGWEKFSQDVLKLDADTIAKLRSKLLTEDN
ncbi:tyrosine-protein phosphatase [Rhodococcus erythropolis]|uniref:tyrosine-protein phosphatase n=1 Tax=Rhodococcus erythropolis TaxID=1833 RepID=UPI001BEB665D|nr:tyrosine-protein phosphatase [Rhodococcus erythropolis]MBT2265279.1 tyrosine-protein phosphatase [Rhodococcus erythropolis]